MSYRGGDRGGPGRGRGGGGDRGGRGGPPRGGGGGGDRGGRGGGGGDRGGRGGFRGGGDRGGGRGGGDRGGGRGGRGGFGGNRPPAEVYSPGPAVIDSRLQDDSEKALVAALKGLKIPPTDLPVRPDFGTRGKVTKVRANFFPVKVPKGPLYEYDIAITPKAKELARRIKKRLFELAEKTPEWTQHGLKGRVAHDYSAKLISSHLLPQPLAITVPYFDEDEPPPKAGGKRYTMEFTFTQHIDTGNLVNYLQGQPNYRDYDIMPVITALNVILASFPNRSGGPGVMVGRNRWFFKTPDSGAVDLGGGLEAWRGFYSSVRPAHNQLMVNVNACTTAFYTPGNLADAINTFTRSSWGARPNSFVKGVRVKATHLGYKKTVKGISNYTAKTYRFRVEEFKAEVTVEEYFLRKYRLRLTHPDTPLVDVGGSKTNLLPAELCEILPNQAFKGKLTDDQTANMITVAANVPSVNAKTIANQGLRELGFSGPNPFGVFDVAVKSDMSVVPARQLPFPGVQYGRGTPAVDGRASWNMREVKFYQGAKLENWAVLLIKDGGRYEFKDTSDPNLLALLKGFAGKCGECGMTVGGPPRLTMATLTPKNRDDGIRSRAVQEIKKKFMELNPKPSIVIVLLSSGDKHIYSGLKKVADTELDLPTVCVQSDKIQKEKGQPQYFANVALKLNMKLGGVNHVLDSNNMQWVKQKPTMLVGIDVTHPGPGSLAGTPSIAAVVANYDPTFAQYPCSLRIQESKKEMVTDLDKMMIERIELFANKNRVLPERIIVYRDGVSEGQFKTVIEQEMPKIKEAFRRFDRQTPYQPKLSIIVCGKRHHTRFYPTDLADADDKGNPKPGLVVDRGVTSIYNFDFFLQAHSGMQGSLRPTHYYVVHDEIGFKADLIQTLTMAVSFMFARATKSVSLVSPAYYADLACERGRCYISKLLQGIKAGGTIGNSSTEKDDVFKEGVALWNNGVSGPNLRDTMFYL